MIGCIKILVFLLVLVMIMYWAIIFILIIVIVLKFLYLVSYWLIWVGCRGLMKIYSCNRFIIMR